MIHLLCSCHAGGALRNAVFHPCVSLSVCLSRASIAKTVYFGAIGYSGTLIGNPMLKVKPTGQCGHTSTKSGQNGKEAVSGTAS